MKITNLKLSFLFLVLSSCLSEQNKHQTVKKTHFNNTKKEEIKIKPFTIKLVEWTNSISQKGDNHFIITDTSLTFYKKSLISEFDSIIIIDTFINASRLQKIISTTEFEKWNSTYNNKNIIPTSGQHLIMNYKTKGSKKEYVFNNFYFKPLDKIISSLNLFLKKEYKISYEKR